MKIFKQVTANNIKLDNYPFTRELAMEAYLIENADILSLDDDNFTEVSILDEEIALKKGRKDRDGRIDILAAYGSEYLSIIELKLNEINNQTLAQLENYLDKKEQILELGKYWDSETSEKPKWIGVVVGTSVSPDLQEKLKGGYKYKEIPIAGIVLNRYRGSDNNIFVISDTYFSHIYSKKDYSKFIYKNKPFNKSRLVNEIIRDYIDLNPKVTFIELKNIFPKQIQGSWGIFDKLSRAKQTYENSGHKRYYINPTETIDLVDGEVIATCNQWNPRNIKSFISNAKKLGFKVKLAD